MTHSYESLTPDLVMDAVESLDYQCNAHILELNSYENRVYQIGIENQELARNSQPTRRRNDLFHSLENEAFL